MKAATKARFDRIDRLLLNLLSLSNLHQEIIMQELDDLKADIQTLKAQGAEAKADSARHEARTGEAVGLLQALSAKIDALATQPGGASPAELAALRTETQAAIADFGAADVQRDAADATLAAGVAANTPADPPVDPLPANPV